MHKLSRSQSLRLPRMALIATAFGAVAVGAFANWRVSDWALGDSPPGNRERQTHVSRDSRPHGDTPPRRRSHGSKSLTLPGSDVEHNSSS